MIDFTFYLSDDKMVDQALELTGLAMDELESIVGRFRQDHLNWPGQLRGEAVVYVSGKVKIRHHFTKKALWENE